MSMSLMVQVRCDKCTEFFEGELGEKSRTVRAEAKKAKWRLGREKDLCPKCAAQQDLDIASDIGA